MYNSSNPLHVSEKRRDMNVITGKGNLVIALLTPIARAILQCIERCFSNVVPRLESGKLSTALHGPHRTKCAQLSKV